MKIAIISHLYPSFEQPFLGKFIQDHVNLLSNSDDINCDLYVPTPYQIPFSKRFKNSNSKLLYSKGNFQRVKYLSFPKTLFLNYTSSILANKLESEVHNVNYDLIHLHWLVQDGLTIPKLSKHGNRCVLTIHGSDWYKFHTKKKLFTKIKEALNHSLLIFCSGNKLKNDILATFPNLRNKIKTIYNFVDSNIYKIPSNTEKTLSKKSLGWQDDLTHVLTVANIRHEKGVDVLIKSILELNTENVVFHIIGQDSNDEYSFSIKQTIQENKIYSVQVHPPIKPSELIRYYHASDFYVLPSRSEGFNVSLLEATSTGLPIIATDVGGNAEVVSNKTGIIIQPNRTDELTDALRLMLNTYRKFNPETIRETTISKYGEKAFLNRLLNYYKDVLEQDTI